MAELHEQVTELSDAAKGVEGTAGAVEQSTAGAVGEKTKEPSGSSSAS